jgi:hypothetical protein
MSSDLKTKSKKTPERKVLKVPKLIDIDYSLLDEVTQQKELKDATKDNDKIIEKIADKKPKKLKKPKEPKEQKDEELVVDKVEKIKKPKKTKTKTDIDFSGLNEDVIEEPIVVDKLEDYNNYPKSLTKFGYLLRKSDLTAKQIATIKTELCVEPVVNKDYCNVEEVIKFDVYKEYENHLAIPRYYGIEHYGQPDYTNMPGKEITAKFKGQLRDYQVEIVDKCYKSITEGGGGLMKLPCAFGKTSISIYMALKLGYKVLVIVHKSFLMTQWQERIAQFSDAKVGVIQRNKIDIKGKDIVIGMLQSLSMINYDSEIFREFNTLIVDECHHIGSRVFSNALFKTCFKYTIGLSATPHRQDQLTKVIHWYIGPMICNVARKSNNKVAVKTFTYESTSKKFVEKKQCMRFNGQFGKAVPAIPKMTTLLTEIEDRNNFIIDIINSLRSKDERKILILSHRIEHLNVLKKGVDDAIEKEELKQECKTYMYYSKTTPSERADAERDCDILFSTFHMASEGLNFGPNSTI